MATGDRIPDRRLPRRRIIAAGGIGLVAGGLALAGRPAAQTAARADGGVVDVAVVGAGLAGLTAGRDLKSAGCESFVVLEARDRVGGRTLNHDLGHGRFSEAGGQWFGGSQTAVADLARQLGVGAFHTYYKGKSVFLSRSARVAVDLHGGPAPDAVSAKLSALARDVPSGAPWTARGAAELDQTSLGDWLAQEKINPQDRIIWELSSKLSGGAAPGKLSLLHLLAMINSADSTYGQLDSMKDGALAQRFVNGSQHLSLKMAQGLGDKVRLSQPVRRIRDWDKRLVTLETDTGSVRARSVIMAIHPGLCQRIAYDPPLPPGRVDLQRRWPAYSPMRKTVHVYPRPFWRARGLSGMIAQSDGPLQMAYDNSPDDGSIGVINAFVVPAGLSADPKQAEQTLSAIYARALGKEALHPVQFHDYDWGADPWAITCVFSAPPGFWTRSGRFLHPAVGRLIWSGSETADLWPGYMDGAVRSGHQAALQALNALVTS